MQSRGPITCNGLQNGDHVDKAATNQTPSSMFLQNSSSADLSSVEALLVNIQGLVKMAAEKARLQEQQINFEKGNCFRMHLF